MSDGIFARLFWQAVAFGPGFLVLILAGRGCGG